MGRGRAPCCEKVGLNRGAWTPEEDMRLIAYIRKYGHGNWRALPKQAGLLRCGKSCRLRWINYLRPDLKRGNFSVEEEEAIIKLHGLLGNKWSKIASSLPGRTDNEIKNVWNTHLKKRLKSNEQSLSSPTPTIIGTVNPEDTPSSSSSGTTSVSIEYKCSQPSQDDTIDIEVLSLDKIEIPILPDFDILDILDVDMEPKITALTNDIEDSIDEIIGIDIEPEVWNDEVTGTTATEEGEVEEKRRWLAYLEEELGLFDDNGGDDDNKMVVVGEGDPVRSYFQKSDHSSPSPM